MPRRRYKQEPLPLGPVAPKPELFGPEQPNRAGLQRMEQGQLGVVPMGPLFDESGVGGSSSGAVPDEHQQQEP